MDPMTPEDLPIQEQDDGSAIVDLPEIEAEEQPDGSAIITLDDGPEFNPDFYDNLADSVEPTKLAELAHRYLDLLETDKEARSLRDKQYEEGIRRTGLGNDAPGGATFMGASKVVHPAMAEGCVDFAARAIKELFPPDGPVKTKVLGKMDNVKAETAERKKDFLNWQITEQIEEFRDEQEQLLTQLPLGGSQYFKLWFDEEKKRPVVEFLPIDRVILPFAATNFYTASPGGIALIGHEKHHAESEGMLIDAGEPIVVVGVKGNRLVVRPASLYDAAVSEPALMDEAEPTNSEHSSAIDFDLPDNA
mgnify:CR=1 FL=1